MTDELRFTVLKPFKMTLQSGILSCRRRRSAKEAIILIDPEFHNTYECGLKDGNPFVLHRNGSNWSSDGVIILAAEDVASLETDGYIRKA